MEYTGPRSAFRVGIRCFRLLEEAYGGLAHARYCALLEQMRVRDRR